MSRLCFRNLAGLVLGLAVFGMGSPERARSLGVPTAEPGDTEWPVPTREARPWTRWWWLGSAVDAPNLTRQLEAFAEAGLGGVEICPIYGAKGAEERYLDFLSSRWMEALAHTTREAERLGLGVDMTTGTGWPFGGPQVAPGEASARLNLFQATVEGGGSLTNALPRGEVITVGAYAEDGAGVDLTDRVLQGKLDWKAPQGRRWTVVALARQQPIQRVKRAAPGGAGYVVDPYSTTALSSYLSPFDRAFAAFRAPFPRAQFHDSFEYFAATWTPGLFEEFERRRGYDLRREVAALAGVGDLDRVSRVRTDYCETLQDLHLEYLGHWTAWSHAHGQKTRNQGHGGPGNLLDFYAAADIPETEIFRQVEEAQVPLLKFASSAAHVTGRRWASSESFTWLGEHFQVTLADTKAAADLLFLGGVNHVFFHGIPYSPSDVAWPGWLFYASTHLGPQGGLWRDLPAFNAYLTRVQSVMQEGEPDNDLLIYWPQHDAWARREGLSVMFTVHDQDRWLWPTPFHRAAMALASAGYAADFISDRQLASAKARPGAIEVGDHPYGALWLPEVERMPLETLRRIIELGRGGATILVQGGLPVDVPGLGHLEQRRSESRALLREIEPPAQSGEPVVRPLGDGALVFGTQLRALAEAGGLRREPMADRGLRFTRRRWAGGHHYFIANLSSEPVDEWVPVATPLTSAVLLDPRIESRRGVAAVRERRGLREVYLALAPRASIVLRTFADRVARGATWREFRPLGAPESLPASWRVEFIEGGPVLPEAYSTDALSSWTTRDDLEAGRFAGAARYTLSFERPSGDPPEWWLDLGKVAETARVRLNGQNLGVLFSPPYRLEVGRALQRGRNWLEVEVTNLAANRIADLDRRQVPWKAFHEINFVNIDYRPFDASDWPPMDSGLLGPVTLTPVEVRSLPSPLGDH